VPARLKFWGIILLVVIVMAAIITLSNRGEWLVKGVEIKPAGHERPISLNAKPGYTKTISSEAGLAAVIEQLKQPNGRFQTFLDLLEFAGYPKGNSQADDPQLNRMRAEAKNAMDQCPHYDDVIATMIRRLAEPDHRLEMIAALLKLPRPTQWYGSVVALSGNSKLDPLWSKAADAADQAADVKTVAKALTNPDFTLRRWGVQKFGNPLGRPEEWRPLLPQMEKIASGDDSDLRGVAVSPLAHFPGTKRFLEKRIAREKSAFVLRGLVEEQPAPEGWLDVLNRKFLARFVPLLSARLQKREARRTERRFLSRFVPLLSDPDETVRDEALNFIGCNDGWARQVHFETDVIDPVIKATESKSANERYLAVFALKYIGRLAPDASRAALLRLVNDPDENVRWRLGFCFAGQYGRGDVKQAVATLVKDKSPLVSYMTILAMGPTNYVPRLQELAHGADLQSAEWASDQLKQIGADK